MIRSGILRSPPPSLTSVVYIQSFWSEAELIVLMRRCWSSDLPPPPASKISHRHPKIHHRLPASTQPSSPGRRHQPLIEVSVWKCLMAVFWGYRHMRFCSTLHFVISFCILYSLVYTVQYSQLLSSKRCSFSSAVSTQPCFHIHWCEFNNAMVKVFLPI